MDHDSLLTSRRDAIAKSWATLDWAGTFSAIIYPLLGVAGLIAAFVLGLALSGLHVSWWYAPLAVAVGLLTVFLCNQGIGPLHRIWQHKAGELKWPAAIVVALNCILAMQGKLGDWVSYHAQHHRHADEPGDPHNPAEGKFWAWIGWILWRDEKDLDRPMAKWLSKNAVIGFADRHHMALTVAMHLIAPAAVYAIVWAAGGSLLLTFILHATAIVGRGVQFHATTFGINVAGHLKVPTWVTYALALLTGGEAFHNHHHDFPRSILHLPKSGVLNRIVDYNGTMLLLAEKLRLARNFHIAPQFA